MGKTSLLAALISAELLKKIAFRNFHSVLPFNCYCLCGILVFPRLFSLLSLSLFFFFFFFSSFRLLKTYSKAVIVDHFASISPLFYLEPLSLLALLNLFIFNLFLPRVLHFFSCISLQWTNGWTVRLLCLPSCRDFN